MALAPGVRLGPYEIVSAIGKGGMGEVYKARDTRLDRTVAIKVLPEHVASDPELKQRFEREAKTISSLNHPHICTLYDVGNQDGVDFLVMEHLEGETLAQRLTKGALPLDQALRTAIEIADALDKAHRQGITHRDLKPGNIMLTKSGAKLLDFGLAKLRPAGAPGAVGLSGAPTISSPLTGAGSILGTFQYMAPEQLEGQEADARTDIFAFGAVVYEMVTGKKAFEGKSQASLIGAIMNSEPAPIVNVQPMSPPALDRVVKKCLAKGQDRRWQTAQDLHDELQWITEAGPQVGVATSAVAAPLGAGWRRALPWVAGAAAGGLICSIVVWGVMQPGTAVPRSPARFVVSTPPDGPLAMSSSQTDVAISPDGMRIVYPVGGGQAQDRELYVRPLHAIEATPLRGAAGGASPFFSPDGEWVGFRVDAQDPTLKKVSILGGPPVTICEDCVPGGTLRGASWGTDDTIAFATAQSGGLLRVPAVGGEPEVLTTVDPEQGETAHWWPHVLPNGKAVLFTTWSGTDESSRIAAVSLETREITYLVPGGSNPHYSPTGHIVYGVGGTLWAVGFDADRLEVTSNPVPVLENVMTKGTGAANFSLSEDGSLVFISGAATGGARTLVWVDRQGNEEVLPIEPGTYIYPRLSPDGTRVALDDRNAENDLWVWDLAQETRTRLTVGEGGGTYPVWTADGGRIVYKDTAGNIYWKAANNTGVPTVVSTAPGTEGSGNPSPYFFSRDGTALVFRDQQNPDTQDNIGMIALEDGAESVWLLDEPFNERNAELSPDGRWMTYQSDESGQWEIYVRPFPNVDDDRITVSNAGGLEPVWSRDGRELFYLEPTVTFPRLMSVAVEPGGPVFSVGMRTPILDWPYQVVGEGRSYDVSPDAQRFFGITAAGTDEATQPQIILVQNWFEELRRLVPTN